MAARNCAGCDARAGDGGFAVYSVARGSILGVGFSLREQHPLAERVEYIHRIQSVTRHTVRSTIASALAALAVLAGSQFAGAAGYWNVPSHFCQWCGCGFGAGYHAPLILGPPTYDCFAGPNEIRVPYAPNPYACAHIAMAAKPERRQR